MNFPTITKSKEAQTRAELQDCIQKTINSIKEKELVIYCGAGISLNSGVPLANDLKLYILEKLSVDKKDIYGYMPKKEMENIFGEKDTSWHELFENPGEENLLFKTNFEDLIYELIDDEIKQKKMLAVCRENIPYSKIKHSIPFELFMEIIAENLDIPDILNMYKDEKKINTNHVLIAKLAKVGLAKNIFTTNFDLLIERALEEEELKRDKDFKVYYNEKHFSEIDFNDDGHKKIRIFKIHGSAEDYKSIRTTMKGVASKVLSDKRKALIRHIFSSGKHKKVLILGYSCSDEFDITPQIQNIGENKKEIIYVDHSTTKEEIEDLKKEENENSSEEEKNPFKSFSGKKIRYNINTLIENIWISLKDISKEEYELIPSETEQKRRAFKWRKYVDEWAKGLEGGEGSFKSFIAGRIFYNISNYNKQIKYYEKSLGIAKAIGDKAGESKCYTNLGVAYDSLGDYKRAIEYYEKSLEIAKAIGDKAEESKCYVNLGTVYESLGDFQRAIEYQEKSLKIAKSIGYKQGELACYTNLGLVYHRLGEYNRAIEYYLKAEGIFKETKQYHYLKVVYDNLSLAYEKTGNYEQSEKYKNLENSI
ncbi:tetratricopeptide repeat protein [bacterium]|nr:tetratricopeptide repeat protein [bacterium]